MRSGEVCDRAVRDMVKPVFGPSQLHHHRAMVVYAAVPVDTGSHGEEMAHRNQGMQRVAPLTKLRQIIRNRCVKPRKQTFVKRNARRE